MEGRRSVGESEGHDAPFERAVAGPKGGLPLVSGGDPNEIVGVSEVDLGIDPSLPRSVEEVRDERERIPILPSDFIEAPVVHT